jgi:serine/threonine-protein kinase
MPPEQWASGTDVTPAADLYALGGTLYYFLTAHSPFPGESAFEQMKGHLNAPPPTLAPIRTDTPASLDRLIAKMMAKDPLQRGTAKQLGAEFQRVLATARFPATAPVNSFPLAPVPQDSGLIQNYSLGSAPSSAQKTQRPRPRGTHAGLRWHDRFLGLMLKVKDHPGVTRFARRCREQFRAWMA